MLLFLFSLVELNFYRENKRFYVFVCVQLEWNDIEQERDGASAFFSIFFFCIGRVCATENARVSRVQNWIKNGHEWPSMLLMRLSWHWHSNIIPVQSAIMTNSMNTKFRETENNHKEIPCDCNRTDVYLWLVRCYSFGAKRKSTKEWKWI